MKHEFTKWFAILLVALAPFGLQAGDEEILNLLKNNAEAVIEKFKSREAELREHPERIYDTVGHMVKPHFDFEAITKSALGKHWKKATPAQRDTIVKEFSELLIRSYGMALLNYSGKPIQYKEPRRSKDGKRVLIQSTVEPAKGKPVDIDYKLHNVGGKWKAYDVVISGITLVTNYRKSFDTEVGNGGIDGLIKSLEKRNEALK